jgi:hypothetical protein
MGARWRFCVLGGSMKKPLRVAIGVLLMVIGVLALLTPCSPGSWLALIGLELLGLRLLFQRKLLLLLPARYRKKVEDFIERIYSKPSIKKLMNRLGVRQHEHKEGDG